jgi:hypothetical protein
VTCSAFEDAGFPWWLQAQIMLLTPGGHEPPDLSADTVVQLVAPKATDSELWNIPGVVAQVRAGVDGDVAAIFCTASSIANQLVTRVAEEAHDAAVQFDQLTEQRFSEALAGD